MTTNSNEARKQNLSPGSEPAEVSQTPLLPPKIGEIVVGTLYSDQGYSRSLRNSDGTLVPRTKVVGGAYINPFFAV